MRAPSERAREAIERWAAARARSEIAGARGGEAARDARDEEARARRALATGEVREALDEAVSMSLIAPDEHGAMLALLARAARDEVRARRGVEGEALRAGARVIVEGAPRTLAELARSALEDPDPRARAAAADAIDDADALLRAPREEAIDEARPIAERVRARGPRSPDADPDDLDALASRFLDATDDAQHETLARLAHGAARPRPARALDVLSLLRAEAIDPLVAPRERARRLGALLAPLGLEETLASRVRVEGAHEGLDVEARVVALDPPRRVAILVAPLELGLASELALATAIGRALALALGAPALPAALRRAWPGSAAHTIGALLAGLHADAVFLRRARGIEGSAVDPLRRHALALVLGRARALAARVIAEAQATEASASARERSELGAALLARALGVSDPTMPASLAEPLAPEPEARRAALRAAMLAPALALALRERFDEDWFRNPRTADVLRGAAARGGALPVEQWAADLGAPPDAAPRALTDLAR